MGLFTESQLVIICDVCGEMETNAGQGRARSITAFRKDGWKISKKVTCPKCSNAKEEAHSSPT